MFASHCAVQTKSTLCVLSLSFRGQRVALCPEPVMHSKLENILWKDVVCWDLFWWNCLKCKAVLILSGSAWCCMNLFNSVNKKLMCIYSRQILFNSIPQTHIILIISIWEGRGCICFFCNYFLFTSLVRDLKCKISQSDSVIRSHGRILFVMMHLKLNLMIRLCGGDIREVHHEKTSFLKISFGKSSEALVMVHVI